MGREGRLCQEGRGGPDKGGRGLIGEGRVVVRGKMAVGGERVVVVGAVGRGVAVVAVLIGGQKVD